jgi:AraC-like DNA-binding protein
LAAPLPDLDRLNRFLADCYHRADLNLATVAKELLMPARRVTTLLNASEGGFKAVLNRFRSQEARRLLSETDVQISEIAFKVGYGNVSHFNRVFRERFGIAPGTMRADLRNRQDPVQNPSKAENAKDPTDPA